MTSPHAAPPCRTPHTLQCTSLNNGSSLLHRVSVRVGRETVGHSRESKFSIEVEGSSPSLMSAGCCMLGVMAPTNVRTAALALRPARPLALLARRCVLPDLFTRPPREHQREVR
jgi:hypothetical protein